MPLKLDRAQIDHSEGDRAQRPHAIPRASPRLEVLEARCLLSDLPATRGTYVDVPRPLRSPQAAIEPLLTAGRVSAASGDADQGSYVVVLATTAPHSTLASAQGLPDAPFFGVIGTLGPDDPIDLYRMTLGAGTVGLQFELVARQQPEAAPVQFSLFDGTGRVLGRWSSDDPSASPISLSLASQSLGPTLYLGISPLGPVGAVPPTNYQLWVTRLAATGPQPNDTGDVSTSPPASSTPLFLAPYQPSATLSPSQPAPSDGSAPAALVPAPTGPSPGAGLSLAIAPMPARTAGPLGGVLAVGDPTTSAVRPLVVTVNLARGDRPSPAPGLDSDPVPGPRAEPVPEAVPETLVALRGPGGFPLLGAAAIGNWRRTPTAVATAPAESPRNPMVPPVPDLDRLAVQDPPAPSIGPPAGVGADAVAGPVASGRRSWAESRVTLSFGLSLATVLTLNVVLSDPVAGFDYLASRLDSDARESPRRRRPPSDPVL